MLVLFLYSGEFTVYLFTDPLSCNELQMIMIIFLCVCLKVYLCFNSVSKKYPGRQITVVEKVCKKEMELFRSGKQEIDTFRQDLQW